jgi:hypothetical protein
MTISEPVRSRRVDACEMILARPLRNRSLLQILHWMSAKAKEIPPSFRKESEHAV